MRLSTSVIALASGVSLASARSTIYDDTIGTGQVSDWSYKFNESNLNDLYSPNSTNSVKFTFGREEWTWRVNVTSLSVPDARLDLDSANGPPLPDPRIIVTTFDLTWPNATETLNETAIRLDERFGASNATPGNSSTYDPICISVMTEPIWPNVTKKLRDSKDGDCEAVLGQECVAALLSEPLLGGGCGNPNLQTPACQGIFNNGHQEVFGYAVSTGSHEENGNSTTVEQTHVGEGIYWANGRASAEPNSTALRQAESQLRVMLLTLPNTKALVCTRVDPSIDDVDVSPISQNSAWDEDKSGGSGSGGGGGDDSSAAGPRFVATVGSVGIVGLAVAVFGLL